MEFPNFKSQADEEEPTIGREKEQPVEKKGKLRWALLSH